MKVYLDTQPKIQQVIRDFIEDLEPSTGVDLFGNKIEELECRSRDGFIPHTHNCGGYDKSWISDLSYIWGSGYAIGSIDQEYSQSVWEEARETYIEYDMPEKYKYILEHTPKDYIDYWSLHRMEMGNIAEELDEYCMDWLRECTVFFGYRFMYEGMEGDTHTLSIYADVNESQHYGICSKGSQTMVEYHLKFKTPEELKRKLDEIKDSLEDAF